MAGIGFEIKKILKKNSLLSVFEAYGYAGLIGSGPWVLSILAMVVVGLISIGVMVSQQMLIQFLVSVTYLMAGSLILTGGLQLMLTRFVSDLLFLKADKEVLPNVLGAVTIVTLVSGVLGFAAIPLFPENTLFYNLLLAGSFVALCNLWMMVIFLSGLKEYKLVLAVMLAGYTLLVILSALLNGFQLEGLITAFFFCHAFLFFAFLAIVIRKYPASGNLVSFRFLDKEKAFYSLFLCGTLYNLGVWSDKFVFWFSQATSEHVVGLFRASLIYDIPIFLAYLSIIPGMAVFLVRIETDFAEQHSKYYQAVLGNATLSEILAIKNEMIAAVRRGIYEIFKIQGITVIALLIWGGVLLEMLGIDLEYRALLNVDLVGVAVQVIFLSILNVLFYLDKRWVANALTGLFFVVNLFFSMLSIKLGPAFYGYGFVLGVSVPTIVGLLWLNKVFNDLEYDTYMLQK
ncbi:exopolysaccharide Pel transporter PelG [Neptunomonas marina]|uniref:Histidine kinase n=1 Tax=Neptunomonas marina TaxID=1815562 RepID=A0A437Q970_9GAMM|nr:exopolysaccharide Pel transporter PelG [Neptunomonas marina]RVU31098.1 histidine kinase [Neptunomonas marina]